MCVIAAPVAQHSIAASAISFGVYGTAGFISFVDPPPTTATEMIRHLSKITSIAIMICKIIMAMLKEI